MRALRFWTRAGAVKRAGAPVRSSREVLSRYTPAERARLLAFVQRRHWVSMTVTSVFIGMGVAAWTLLVSDLASRRLQGRPGIGEWVRAEPASGVVTCGVLFALLWLGPMCGLLVRDRWLRWALGRHVSETSCHDCAYLLADLPVDEGRVTCPECGEAQVVVASRGLIPARWVDAGV